MQKSWEFILIIFPLTDIKLGVVRILMSHNKQELSTNFVVTIILSNP